MSQSPEFAVIQETLALLGDWEDRYAYLIDLGRKLPPYPETLRDEAHKVPGCTSQVWMAHRWEEGGRLRMDVDSDAHLVKGLLAILMALYNDRTPDQIRTEDPKTRFAVLGLEGHLSPNRRNGFFAVATRINQLAQTKFPLPPGEG
jgi:cysteine desulfuration protein SufE